MALTADMTSVGTLRLELGEIFAMDHDPTGAQTAAALIHNHPETRTVVLDGRRLTRWDSTLVLFVRDMEHYCRDNHFTLEKADLPSGVESLLTLTQQETPRPDKTSHPERSHFIKRLGARALMLLEKAGVVIEFLGAVILATRSLLMGMGPVRFRDFFPIFKECTVGALPIVSLISALVGLILAFVGAVQLVMFGAQIYVAALVGIAMMRVMGAVMVGVIMAGRTGAAFAAQLGTMEANEEIDALKTLGVDPMTFLVVPRVVALSFALPLLCVYADIMGILGGMAVGVFMLDLNPAAYLQMTRESVGPASFWVGLFHSWVFGILVALAGCFKGIHCKRNASAVGRATTGAVVSAIVAIVIATAVITVLCDILGI